MVSVQCHQYIYMISHVASRKLPSFGRCAPWDASCPKKAIRDFIVTDSHYAQPLA